MFYEDGWIAGSSPAMTTWFLRGASLAPRQARLPLRPRHRPRQRGVDARLPAGAGRAEMVEHVLIEARLDRLLWPLELRASAPDELVAAVDVGALEIFIAEFRRVVGVNPALRDACASALLLWHDNTSSR